MNIGEKLIFLVGEDKLKDKYTKLKNKEGILLNKIKDFELPEINGGIKC